jgi:DNA polymerase I
MEMAQRHLEEFSCAKAKPSKEVEAEAPPFTEAIEKEIKKRAFPPIAPQNLSPSYFVSATYHGKTRKALIKLYEPTSSRIYFWYDNTGHMPYCLTSLSPYELGKINRLIRHPGFDRFEIVEKFDPLMNRNVKVTKVVAKDPLAIGGRARGCIRDIIPEEFPKTSDTSVSPEEIKVWESRIKYYQSYIYDRNLLPGMIYEIKNGNLAPKSLKEAEGMTKHIREKFQNATLEELQNSAV